MNSFDTLAIGYDIPARPGMAEAEIVTPCLILDLDALERNLRAMAAFAATHGIALRPHGKMHKSPDLARLQARIGGASGICAQKVSEAEAFVRAGILDVLVTNQVRQPVMIDRLARLPLLGARIGVCVDDPDNVAELSAATQRHGTVLRVLMEIECGGGRCGVLAAEDAVPLAQAITAAPGLRFGGIHAYQGAAQHVEDATARARDITHAVTLARAAKEALAAAGLPCETITGGGTGSFPFETASGVYTELQCGSYAFMDADYARIRTQQDSTLDSVWEHALFVLTSVLSHNRPDLAVVDAGLKVMSLDSGVPTVFGRGDVTYTRCSDEHGEVSDPNGALKVGDTLRLVPGHCDPTCNLHDWFVGVRNGRVESLWPISARGKAW